MKLAYGSVPVKALNINYFEQDTNDCDMIASDLQAGKTAVARGQKIVGTGKSFSFATYGDFPMGIPYPVPTSDINTIILSSHTHPVKMEMSIIKLRDVDFTTAQQVASVIIDGVDYPITLQILNNLLTISCSQTTTLQVMFGKDEYI